LKISLLKSSEEKFFCVSIQGKIFRNGFLINLIIGIYCAKSRGGIVEIRKINDFTINPDALVKVKEMGNIVELMWSESYTSKCNIKRLDFENYIDLRDGEIKQFKHIDNRACDLASVSKTLRRLRDYLNTNIIDVSYCRWITLTYAENMTDTNKLYKDFRDFNKRLKYHLNMHYEYIVAMEPQGRGAWHAHIVLIFDSKAPYIPNDDMARIWGYGFTTTKKLDDVDNVGAYLTAYLGDMELEEVKTCVKVHEFVGKKLDVKEVEFEENGVKKTKQYIKGARLHMYPPKFNIYRCSRGIKKPIVTFQHEEMAQKKVSAGTLTFQKTIQLSDAENDFKKTINYRYYNSKRGKKQ